MVYRSNPSRQQSLRSTSKSFENSNSRLAHRYAGVYLITDATKSSGLFRSERSSRVLVALRVLDF
jgi:hypothetical protein